LCHPDPAVHPAELDKPSLLKPEITPLQAELQEKMKEDDIL
jgi:hypothetical protein